MTELSVSVEKLCAMVLGAGLSPGAIAIARSVGCVGYDVARCLVDTPVWRYEAICKCMHCLFES